VKGGELNMAKVLYKVVWKWNNETTSICSKKGREDP
jgi:hypothetical protein